MNDFKRTLQMHTELILTNADTYNRKKIKLRVTSCQTERGVAKARVQFA